MKSQLISFFAQIFPAVFALSSMIAQDGVTRAIPVAGEPVPLQEGASISRFADSRLIRQPTGIVFTKSGKLLVIQSNTHFRPEGYEGPENDQILWIRDTDGDGVADTRTVFYDENLVATMDIAVHPETGAIYVATRNEVMRLWDEDQDGIADPDRIERRLVFLDTEGDYPHNGCSGLTFDDLGNLIFGIGENLGAAYNLIGSDGRKISDQGEGGNIWWCQADGSSLMRFATGFWNPFGVCHAPGGFLFATDNDPGSRPPSRLHFVIFGGDYGYQYRYGRSGQHPFISWDGELPGTLPMLHGTGEAPCDVLYHEGHLYVASWADRRIERYPLTWNETHFETEQEIIVQGEGEFRPVAFAIGPDGSLYCSDWGKSDYKLHGEGSIWKLDRWASEPRSMPDDQARIALMKAPLEESIADPRYWTDPWLAPATVNTLAKHTETHLGLHRPDPGNPEFSAHQRALMLLAWRKSNPEDPTGLAAFCLKDPDPTVKLLALKWISDETLGADRGMVEAIVNVPPSPKIFLAAITALARIDGLDVGDKAIQKLVGERLKRADVTPEVRRTAFRVLADREKFLSVADLRTIFEGGDPELQIEVMLALLTHPDSKAAKTFAREVKNNPETSKRVVRFAREVAGRAAAPLADDSSRPPVSDTAAWSKFLDSIDRTGQSPEHRLDHGRLVFHRHCASCHRVDGFGRQGGPDLTTIHERGEEHILRSVLDPGAEVAPQYEPWQLTLTDRSEKIGFLLGQEGGKSIFADISGNEFEIDYREIVKRRQIAVSLMPPGLFNLMADGEIADLLFWLSRKR